jgi:hypothetical protein
MSKVEQKLRDLILTAQIAGADQSFTMALQYALFKLQNTGKPELKLIKGGLT